MTFKKLEEQFEHFKTANKISNKHFLKLADARIGKRVAIFKKVGNAGSIELAGGQFFTFSEFDAWMAGYNDHVNKRLR